MSESIETYPDSNHDSIPDAFENRLSISEILNGDMRDSDPPPVGDTAIVEVERAVRAAKEGEMVFTAYGLETCLSYDPIRYRGCIVRRIIA